MDVPPERLPARLIDGLKIALALAINTAVGFDALRRINQTLLPPAITFALAAGVGIASGFATRHSLKNRPEVWRVIVASAMVVSALILLGLATRGEAGLNLLFRSHLETDWEGLGQVMVGMSGAYLALRAWRRPVQIAPRELPERQQLPIPPRPAPRFRGIARPRFSPIVFPRVTFPRIALHLPHLAMPHWRLPRLRSNHRIVRVSRSEEHRCPYCLDLVEHNDHRGIKVCSTCQAWHHEDCWAITGTCQVPHFHA